MIRKRQRKSSSSTKRTNIHDSIPISASDATVPESATLEGSGMTQDPEIPLIKKTKKKRGTEASTRLDRAKKMESERNDDTLRRVVDLGMQQESVPHDSTVSHKEVIEIDDDEAPSATSTQISAQHAFSAAELSSSRHIQDLMAFNMQRSMQKESTAEDFISLSSTRQEVTHIMSDDDSSSDGVDDSNDLVKTTEEEYQGDIQFGEPLKRKTSEERVIWSKKFEDIDTEIDVAMDEPEQGGRQDWEVEQMRNAGVSLQPSQKKSPETIFGQEVIDLTDDAATTATLSPSSSSKKRKVNPVSPTPAAFVNTSILPSYQQMREIMMQQLQSIQDTNAKFRSQLQNLNLLVEQSEMESVAIPQTELKHKSEEYQFYKEIRDYSKELLQCYDYIVPRINACAEELLQLRENVLGKEAFARWRRQIQIVYVEALKAQGLAGPDALGNGEQSPTAQTSELGPIAAYKLTEAYTQYHQQRHSKLTHIKSLFDEIEQDFSSIPRICTEFEKWKRRFPKSYLDSFTSHSVRKLLTPYVRMHLLGWNPLSDTDFSKYEFFDALEDYGNVPLPAEILQENTSSNGIGGASLTTDVHAIDLESSHANDLDPSILNDLIHDVATPMLLHFVRHEYDPLSAHDVVQLKVLLKENTPFFVFQSENKPYASWSELCQCLVDRMRQCVDCLVDVNPQLYQGNAPSNQPLNTFIQFQLNLSAALLESCWSWVSEEYLSLNTVRELILETLMKRKVLPVLRCIRDVQESQVVFEKVLTKVPLPDEWIQELHRAWRR